MPVSELLEVARSRGLEAFENRCLQLLEEGRLSLPQLATAFEQLEHDGQAERLATLAQMVLENADVTADPHSALPLARVALTTAPRNEALIRLTADLYRRAFGQTPGFDVVLAASGLTAGRPVRNALKLLDLCLALQPGDALYSRLDDRVVEVAEIDRANGLFVLRREGRTTTVPAAEVARDYDRIAADDFRVLRQLRPERLARLIEDDPVAVVLGLIHAHGSHIDVEVLKHELVPRFIESKDWSRWWTRARGLIKRAPNIVMEGRAPVILSYRAAARTLEEETWAALGRHNDPLDWMATIESYLREKADRQEPADSALLERFAGHLLQYVEAVRARRPAEALTCALILDRLGERGVPLPAESAGLSGNLLREAADPGRLLREVDHEGLRDRGIEVLQAARPDDWLTFALAWLPTAPAPLLDRIAAAAVDAGQTAAVQAFIDAGLGDPARNPELLFWLWKGPRCRDALRLPTDDDLFRLILDTLSALGRTLPAEAEVIKVFRQRMKAALSLRDYDKVRQVFQRLSDAAAIPVRRQLERLEGLGENAPARMKDLLRDVHPQLWVVRRTELQPWEDQETIWCTAEGLARRTAERDELLNKHLPENARRIGEAAAHGDLSENSEYKFALEERDLLRARLAKLNDELSRARQLEPHDVPADSVGIGSRVTLRRIDTGELRVMTFLGPFETDVDRGIFSYLAPVSQKLMGARAGDRVTLITDNHEQLYEVASVEPVLRRPTVGSD